jgi:hypothetical protein
MYCLIEDGLIISGPKRLPHNWRNISGLNNMTDPELLVLGWYPYVETVDPLPNKYYRLDKTEPVVITATEVTKHIVAVQIEVDTIKSDKLNTISMAAQVQDLGAEGFEGKKTDAEIWSDENGVALDILTDRVDVEAFDESIPVRIPVPSERAANAMMDQAEIYLLTENFRAEVGAGSRVSPEKLAIIHGWMLANYEAIDNGTPAVTPPEEIRQRVRVPGEHRQRFLLKRILVDDRYGFQGWIDGDDPDGLTLKAFNVSDVELFELTFALDGEGRWTCTTDAGQTAVNEMAFKFSLVWNGNNVLSPVSMAVGKSRHDIRGLRWGGV